MRLSVPMMPEVAAMDYNMMARAIEHAPLCAIDTLPRRYEWFELTHMRQRLYEGLLVSAKELGLNLGTATSWTRWNDDLACVEVIVMACVLP